MFNWGKTSTWFGGYGNEDKDSVIKVDKSKNARRYGSTSLASIPAPKEQTWLSSLLDTTGVIKSDLYKGPTSNAGSDDLVNYSGSPKIAQAMTTPQTGSRDFLGMYGEAKGTNGDTVYVNGMPYVDRFDHGSAEKGSVADTPTSTIVPENTTVSENTITPESTPDEDAQVVVNFEDMIRKIKEEWTTAEGKLSDEGKELLDEAKAMYTSIVEMLNAKYNNIMSMLGDEKSASEQRAAINHAKLLKYLPDQLRSMGLGSLGTSQSAFLKAYNQYNNQLSAAQQEYKKGSLDAYSTHLSGLASALSQYSANKNSVRSYIGNKENSLRDYYGGKISTLEGYAYDDKVRADDREFRKELLDTEIAANEKTVANTIADDTLKLKQENTANAAGARLQDYTQFDTMEDVDKFLNRFTDPKSPEYVGEAFAPTLQVYAETTKDTIAKIEEAEAARLGAVDTDITFKKNVGKDHGFENDDIKVNVGDKTVKVTLGENVRGTDAYNAATSYDPDTFFIYDGQLYYKTENNKVVEVKTGTKGYNTIYNHLMTKK